MIKLVIDDTASGSTHDTYKIFKDEDNIGRCQLRHVASKNIKMPKGFENNIYYEIMEEYRKKGYGSEVLSLLVEKARKIDLENIIVTVKDSNVGSIKIIEKNSGILQCKEKDTHNVLYRKYLISLI